MAHTVRICECRDGAHPGMTKKAPRQGILTNMYEMWGGAIIKTQTIKTLVSEFRFTILLVLYVTGIVLKYSTYVYSVRRVRTRFFGMMILPGDLNWGNMDAGCWKYNLLLSSNYAVESRIIAFPESWKQQTENFSMLKGWSSCEDSQ